MSINLKKENKKQIVETYGKNGQDTGSVEVQIAMLTQKISVPKNIILSRNNLEKISNERSPLDDASITVGI